MLCFQLGQDDGTTFIKNNRSIFRILLQTIQDETPIDKF